MADWNRYRRQEFGDDQERGGRRDRQPEQFQTDRPYGDDYAQMGDDHSQGRYGGQQEDIGPEDDRYGSSWREDRGPSRDRGYRGDMSGGFGRANVSNRERGGFGSFTSETYRTAGGVGPREHQGYGRGQSAARGAYSGGSYGAGTYGAAPRREYGNRGYGSDHDRGFFEKAGDEVASWFGDEDAARRREQDHRGRGPANYTRSDERILEDACDRLTEDWGVDARNIQVTVQSGEVTLDGKVESRSHKRRAEDVVHDISGVRHVQNNLRIDQSLGGSGNRDDNATAERNTGTLA